jgi:hypothetical protein
MDVSLRALGWYHVAGALAGAALTTWAWAHGAALPGGSFSAASVPFALTLLAGLRLVRAQVGARRLAVAAQVLQVPIVIIPAVTWKFIAGAIASVTLTPAGLSLYGGLEASWYVGRGEPGPIPMALGVNLAPAVVIALLLRAPAESVRSVPVEASRPAA